MSTRCIIVEDEPIARDIIESYLKKVDGFNLIGTCNNSLEALTLLQQESVDLMFLDIQMPGLNGISFLKTLSHPPSVILTTAYREYAVESYELDVLDYLLKPIPFERFLTAVNKFSRLQSNVDRPNTSPPVEPTGDYIYLSVDKRMVKVILSDILFIESQRDYIRIKTLDDELLVHRNISFAEDKLPEDKFLRIHRSFMVAIEKIDAYNSSLITVGGKEIPIGRNYKKQVIHTLNSRNQIW